MAKKKPNPDIWGAAQEDAKPKEIPQENKNESKLIPLGNRKAHGYRIEKRYTRDVELLSAISGRSKADIVNEALAEYLERLSKEDRAKLDLLR